MTKMGLNRYTSSILIIIQLFFGTSLHADAVKPKIGVILPLSGAFERYGDKIRGEIAKSVNKEFEIVYEDEGCDPKIALSAYKKLTEIDHIATIIGPWCGSPQIAIASLLGTTHLAILGSSAPERVYDISRGAMLAVQHSIESESTFLASTMNDQHIGSVITVFKENQFSRAHEAAFRKTYKGTIVETLAYTGDDASELKGIALKVKRLSPKALYVPDVYPLIQGLLKELARIGVGKLLIYSVYAAQSDDVLNVINQVGYQDTFYYSYPETPQDEDAFSYFPRRAVSLIQRAVQNGCSISDVSCLKSKILSNDRFNAHGVLEQKIILKGISGGKFTRLNNLGVSHYTAEAFSGEK